MDSKGAILLETAIIAPILVFFALVGVDYFIYTKSKTFVTQIARESVLYLATVPASTLDASYITVDKPDPDTEQTCLAVNNDGLCPHVLTVSRAVKLINTNNNYVKTAEAIYNTSFDGSVVRVQIDVPTKNIFGILGENVQAVAYLPRSDVVVGCVPTIDCFEIRGGSTANCCSNGDPGCTCSSALCFNGCSYQTVYGCG